MQDCLQLKWNFVIGVLALTVALGFSRDAHAQTTPTGQVVTPGAKGSRAGSTTNCGGQDGVAAATGTTDPTCGELGPNFATPSAGVTAPQRPRPFTGIVRIDAVVPAPSGSTPDTDSLNVVGSATVLKTRRPGLKECLYTGKNWSTKSNASTFTTCMDYRGEVVAYQDCKVPPSDTSAACTVVTPQDTSKSQAVTKAQ